MTALRAEPTAAPAGETAPPPEFRAVAPGVWTARLPLPYRLNHVFVYLLDTDDGRLLVDCGIGTEAGLAVWQDLLQRLPDGPPIRRILVTHYHPDHLGAAGWLAERLGARLSMSEAEWLTARALLGQTRAVWAAAARPYWRLAGLSADTMALLEDRGSSYIQQVQPLPPQVDVIGAGWRLATPQGRWTSFTVSGHSPAQLCLARDDASLLLAGDHLLPRISPNVSAWASDPLEDPLGKFQRTLRRLMALPPGMLVLPGHGPSFTGAAARAAELLAHHEERLALLESHAQGGAFTVQAAVDLLFRPGLDAHQTGFAVGEALAHLNRLVATGRLIRRESDGVWQFSRP